MARSTEKKAAGKRRQATVREMIRAVAEQRRVLVVSYKNVLTGKIDDAEIRRTVDVLSDVIRFLRRGNGTQH